MIEAATVAVKGPIVTNRSFGRIRRCGRELEGPETAVFEQQHVRDVAGQYAGLQSGAGSDNLVGVHALVRLFAGQLLDQFLDHRHPGGTADHHDVFDVAHRDAGVLDGGQHRTFHPGEQVV